MEIGILIRELERHSITIDLMPGELLFRCGELCIGTYIVRSGRIALIWATERNIYPMVSTGPISILGLVATLDGCYSCTARAVEQTRLGFVGVEVVNHILDRDPQLWRLATRLIADEISYMQRAVAQMPAISSDLKKDSGV